MQDKTGHTYAKLSELKSGDLVKIDSGFDCMGTGVHQVRANGDKLYLSCSHGRHYLDGQLDDQNHTHLIGVYPNA